MRRLFPWIYPLFAGILLAAALTGLTAGCSQEGSQADQISQKAEALRTAATDKLQRATATIDVQVGGLSVGSIVPPDQTEKAAASALRDLAAAQDDLNQRQATLSGADQLSINDSWRRYFSLMAENNRQLSATLIAAARIPTLMQQEEYALAGWDEVRQQKVAGQVQQLQQDVDSSYSNADILRNQAEQLRQDNPGDFDS